MFQSSPYADRSQSSPYIAQKEYQAPPTGCHITQVNILQRHGARSPTSSASVELRRTLDKLLNKSEYFEPWLFLANYSYSLGENDLLKFGAKESLRAGSEAAERYASLSRLQRGIFVRASVSLAIRCASGVPEFIHKLADEWIQDSLRVVQSAGNWSLGFSGGFGTPLLRLSEKEGANNTLENFCPRGSASLTEQQQWQALFAPDILARIDPDNKFKLDDQDVIHLAYLCAFESLAEEVVSAFCHLFTDEDWRAIEYHGDLGKFYGWGYGNQLGPAQGVGWVHELLARLTGNRAYAQNDTTQVNHTLAADAQTFPLDRSLYVDFSHDNQMTAIMTLIGLFHDSKPLSPVRADPKRHFVASHIIPFAGRLTIERLSCKTSQGHSEHVRVLVSDAIQDLRRICGRAFSIADGLCQLPAFIRVMERTTARGAEMYKQCF